MDGAQQATHTFVPIILQMFLRVSASQETLQAAFSKARHTPQQATKRGKDPKVTPGNLLQRIKPQ